MTMIKEELGIQSVFPIWGQIKGLVLFTFGKRSQLSSSPQGQAKKHPRATLRWSKWRFTLEVCREVLLCCDMNHGNIPRVQTKPG